MVQTQKISKGNTTVRMEGNKTIVTLYSTDVVTVTDDKIILNTGGWPTATTFSRMNQTSNQFNLGYRAFRKAYRCFVEYKGVTYPFVNGSVELKR